MVGLLYLCARDQSDLTSAERRGVFCDLWLSRLLQSREEESQCGWCVVLSFTYLSLSLPQSWSFVLRVSFAFLWSGSAVEKFVLYSVFVFRSDQIGFSLFFTMKVTDWLKNYFWLFYFWQISLIFCYALVLCAAAPFSILKNILAPITFGECSCGC